jgi:hypothetical protein
VEGVAHGAALSTFPHRPEEPSEGTGPQHVGSAASVASVGEILGMRWGMRDPSIPGTSVTPDPRNQALFAWLRGSFWARQDSNLGPTDYESAALTAELQALDLPEP